MQLKTQLFEQVKSEAASKEEIIRYLRQVDVFENVDLDTERQIAREKLSLLRLIQSSVDGKLNPDGADARIIRQKSVNSASKLEMAVPEDPNCQDTLQIIEDVRTTREILAGLERDQASSKATGSDVMKQMLTGGSQMDGDNEEIILQLIDPENNSISETSSSLKKPPAKSGESIRAQWYS
jgi:hypothetical protein